MASSRYNRNTASSRLRIMASTLRNCTSPLFFSRFSGVMATRKPKMPRWTGSSKKAKIMPRKMGRRMWARVPKKARRADRWNKVKNSSSAAAITAKAVTPTAI